MAAIVESEEAGDLNDFFDLLADDIILRSPATEFFRFEGVDQVRDVLSRIFPTISNVTLIDVVGANNDTQILVWSAEINGIRYEEINLFRMNETGKIREMTVYFRPVRPLLELVAVIVPSLASKRGRIRSVMLKLPTRFLALMYSLSEPLISRLIGAGVPIERNAR